MFLAVPIFMVNIKKLNVTLAAACTLRWSTAVISECCDFSAPPYFFLPLSQSLLSFIMLFWVQPISLAPVPISNDKIASTATSPNFSPAISEWESRKWFIDFTFRAYHIDLRKADKIQ